jgi:putative N6-adenine-specific DNA methylase
VTSRTAALDLFAVTAPGLEHVCAHELHALGIAGEPGDGGVAWRGDLRSMYRANLESRTASRIVARIGAFRARTFAELERHAARLDWGRFIAPGAAVSLRVTCRKSKLYHEGAVAERVAGVLAHRVGAQSVVSRDAEGENEDDDRLIVVRCFRDVCTFSADSSGALLHQRGYRQALAKAPLRETIAAAMLLATGWRGDTPLMDPLCGAGTIPIEGALIARGIAPGLARADRAPRHFAFEAWPGFDVGCWRGVVGAALDAVRPAATADIVGADRDGGAIAAARANAERAGVAQDIRLVQRPLSGLATQPAPGHLVTNPPYGVRVGDRIRLRALYSAFGAVAAERLAGWTVAMLSADPRLEATTRLPLSELLHTRNGGIPVRLLAGVVPDSATHSRVTTG